ncbi:MAG TPA: Maf family protein [Vicinamibacterales bacterium]|nr:Maf family protein [Vicinamibacterales bacterium]
MTDARATRPRIVLASGSARRRELLAAAGLLVDVDPANVDESVHPGETPAAYVERVAIAKATTGARRHPDAAVLGGDTTVVVDGDIFAKPEDDNDARRMLERLSGRPHDVLTGVALAWRGALHARVEKTRVWFRPLSTDEIAWYVASGEPRDRAGAYAIQGLASRFIPRIDGSYTNVVGLPVTIVLALLEDAGIEFGVHSA